jgi:hypothetical protein
MLRQGLMHRSKTPLLDDLVGGGKQFVGDAEAERAH